MKVLGYWAFALFIFLAGSVDMSDSAFLDSVTVSGNAVTAGVWDDAVIDNESVVETDIQEDSVTISWVTHIPAMSRVVYDTVSHPDPLGSSTCTAPDLTDFECYGYANTTNKDSAKVTDHSVVITGLMSGTTYFYRVISSASPEVVSVEKSFTTASEAPSDPDVTISGFKWHDLNGNGERDSGEPGLDGWIINLYQHDGTAWVLVDTAMTDLAGGQNGFYEFTGLTDGLYKVCEVLQAGWVQITPSLWWSLGGGAGSSTDECDGEEEGEWGWLVDTEEDELEEVNFGNRAFPEIPLFKFLDVLGDGVFDPDAGDAGLANWWMLLLRETDEESADGLLEVEASNPGLESIPVEIVALHLTGSSSTDITVPDLPQFEGEESKPDRYFVLEQQCGGEDTPWDRTFPSDSSFDITLGFDIPLLHEHPGCGFATAEQGIAAPGEALHSLHFDSDGFWEALIHWNGHKEVSEFSSEQGVIDLPFRFGNHCLDGECGGVVNGNGAVSTGDVVINEVMWMGSGLSALDEWIELRNMTGSDIDISGWQIDNARSSNNTLILLGEYMIPANGFFLIARRLGEETAITVAADKITSSGNVMGLSQDYSGNEPLRLRDADGNIIDQTPELADENGSDDEWPAGEVISGEKRWSMQRRTVPGDGADGANWYTCDRNALMSAGVLDIMLGYWKADHQSVNCGTPGSMNLGDIDG